jgi:hypothetical protein
MSLVALCAFLLPYVPARAEDPEPPAPDSAQIRLYNFRHATLVAAQFGSLFPLLSLSSASSSAGAAAPSDVPDDLLVVIPKTVPPTDSKGVSKSIGELKRVVALLDLPRPQVTLQAWAIKVSSKDPNEIDDAVKRLQQQIDDRNLRIQRALKFGWFKLMAGAQAPGFLDRDFRAYISKPFVIDDARKPEQYSLGFVHAFAPDQPSIATMLLCLAASNDPRKWIDAVVDDMDQQTKIPDALGKDGQASGTESPTFKNFRAYLHALADPLDASSTTAITSNAAGLSWAGAKGQQWALRAAFADFLFQYKWATQYPHEFVGYDLQNSATVLDSLFAPVVDALNRDIADYVKGITDSSKEVLARRGAKTQLASRGILTVSSISGQQAIVEGKTSSYFDITKPPTLAEMVQGMNESQSLLSTLIPQLTGNPAKVAAALAAISSQEKTFVQLDKGMKLVITPVTLATAASAELNIDFGGGGGDNGQPADAAPPFKGAKTSPVYTVDSINQHSVQTKVRVDSLKLFEVSTFSYDLMHPQPDGVVPVVGQVWQGVFGAVPYVGRLFTWHKSPELSAHRSVIIVSALIVPTSMDLALGIRVESDRKLTAASTAGGDMHTHKFQSIEDDPLLLKARPFHKKKLECMLTPDEWVTFAKDGCSCAGLSLSCVAADSR